MKRRDFCKASAIAGAGLLTAPSCVTRNSANSKVNIAFVGVGGIGQFGINVSLEENIVGLCDVYWGENSKYPDRSAMAQSRKVPDAKRFTDYRKMLDKMDREIDAVAVCTPDHTHFPIAMEAMQRGKHVFVQKPLARNIFQVRTLQEAAKKYNVKTVMGNQGHCFEGAHRIVDWVKNGILGDVEEIHCWTDRPRLPWFPGFKTNPPESSPVPRGFDWDIWQGPVAECDFSHEYAPMRWRGWWKYGCGSLGDIGCHLLDAPTWALDLGYPEKVEVVEIDAWENIHYTPKGVHLIFHFPARGSLKPVKLHWYEGKFRPKKLEGMDKLPTNGMIMKGSKETLFHEDMRAVKPVLWPIERMNDYKKVLEEQVIPRSHTGNPYTDLWAAVRGDIASAESNFDYAAPLTETVLLGAMAIRANETITWDAINMKCSSPVAQHWVDEPVRDGWEYKL